ncbi:DUF4214 domain-containing protein [Methylobacterium durans]|uniref:DUF4214 domain-containing protein n=1 Tax=Methylobacterium durans TaxID=2202825 RepID=A0A2U8W427_9HYPH|nr:DUF4214 domain-containing protein [Methylobacterium durans]AWN40270.1 hypothetical protein DK389_06620 [Methylobacterium durans]
MTHFQTVAGSAGSWVFELPEQVTISQGGRTDNLVLNGANTTPLVFDIHYDEAAWLGLHSQRDTTHGRLVIKVHEPSNNVDSLDVGLRGSVNFVFHNDLGAPISEGPNGAVGIFVNGPGDNTGDTQFHPTYAHLHGIAANVFPGHTVTSRVLVGPGPGNIGAPDEVTVHGAITSSPAGEQWGPLTLHQRQQVNHNDDFEIHFWPQSGSVSFEDSGRLNTNNYLNKPYFGTFIQGAQSAGGQIYAIYDGLLGRAPDSLGLEYWADRLEHGTTVRDLTQQVLNSSEGQARVGSLNDGVFVNHLYETMLNRNPNDEERDFWSDQLYRGATRADVADGFVFSPEHLASLTLEFSLSIFVPDRQASDVARLYYTLLDRMPDLGGLQYWTDQLNQGRSLSSVADSFLTTPELQARYGAVDNAAYVDALYVNALWRHSESAFWALQLNNGLPRGEVAAQISSSPESQYLHLGQIEEGWHLI